MSLASKLFGLISLFAVGSALAGCPSGKCLFQFKEVDHAGNVKSDKCLVDTCPKNSAFAEGAGCTCNQGFVTMGGACVTEADANASCGAGYQYANGGCVAKGCPPGQIVDAQTGNCQTKSEADRQVAQNAGVTLKEGQSVGCPAGYTYVVNGNEGACVPNELTCGPGTKYQNGACVAVSCPAGQVLDSATGQCVKLNQGDEKVFSVQAKLKASMGPSFCAPHAKNPGGFGVQPGNSLTIKVSVSLVVPNNDIEQTQIQQVKTTNVGGAELTAQTHPGVAKINKQVEDQIVKSIKALGGKSVEAQASSEVTCVIKRAPIQVVETHGGGV